MVYLRSSIVQTGSLSPDLFKRPYLLQILRGSKHACLGAIHGAWFRVSPPLPATGALAFLLQKHQELSDPSPILWPLTTMPILWATCDLHLVHSACAQTQKCLTLSYLGSAANLALPPRPAIPSAIQSPFCRYSTPYGRSLTYSGQQIMVLLSQVSHMIPYMSFKPHSYHFWH